MSPRRLAEPHVQPATFAFTAENAAWAKGQIARYPESRQASAVIPLLWRAQEQSGGWVPQKAIEHVAELLGMAKIRVLEVATFYTMFNLEPVGKFHVQLCTTTPCMLRGSDALQKVCRRRIGEQLHVTDDGKFSWVEVECLGACVNAPMAQINYDYYEDLTPESFEKILDDMAAGRTPKPGPQIDRQLSAPVGEWTTLKDPSIYVDRTAVVEAVPPPEAPPASELAEASLVPEIAAPEPAPPETTAPPPAPTPPATVDAETKPEPEIPSAPSVAPIPAAAAEEPVSDEYKPELLATARDGTPDDLKMIWGVGRKLEAMLHGMGVFHFDQIAAWTDMNLRWVDQNLTGFKGRAVRDKWVEQAAKLATGWRPSTDVGEKPKSE